MSVRILVGDALEQMRALPSCSVQTCVTSPPYWGLRDYNTAPVIWGGHPDCPHEWGTPQTKTGGGPQPSEKVRWQHKQEGNKGHRGADAGVFCTICRAWRGHLGLEKDPRDYLTHMVEVFAEVRRVLRNDGTLWLNMGDNYTDGGRGKDTGSTLLGTRSNHSESRKARNRENARPFGLGSKQLVGMPWRLALALQDDGWVLRSDIIWHKPNPMPESVTDRPTKAHEYLFLFAKRARYFYDRRAIAEPVSGTARPRGTDGVGRKAKIPAGWATATGRAHTELAGNYTGTRAERPQSRLRMKSNPSFLGAVKELVARKNKRDVWTILPKGFKGAHFATFPPALVVPCVLAGSADRACELCGAPWRPIYGDPVSVEGRESGNLARKYREDFGGPPGKFKRQAHAVPWKPTAVDVVGGTATCKCSLGTGAGRCVVLDIFGGSGTTALVAEQLGRDSILIELSTEYAAIARKRLGLEEGIA